MPLRHRQDYCPFPWTVHHVELDFDLDAQSTLVHSRMQLSIKHVENEGPTPGGEAYTLTLDGEELELEAIRVNGLTLDPDRYTLDEEKLKLFGLPEQCCVEIRVRISPAANASLSGLYQSGNNLLTQCEAEGFRRISFFPDRPDVMSRYRVRLRAHPCQYPVLLSNGNCLANTQLADGRIESLWEDPFPKPSYLFAIVAGKLIAQEQSIRTASGREALLQVWVEPGNQDKTDWCMASLQRALRWDESRFGLELDLERFMIVATADFNMGAMENKGLNIFNTKYVFAHPTMATDADFAAIESVVGHEYFHNWTGNRVTCRDWFQLTLKEGLTVFRDQEFSADMAAAAAVAATSIEGTQVLGVSAASSDAAAGSARAVLRIAQIRTLKALQFPEDAGPMAHPVRPESYSAIDNFYTMTVYEKGAELVRMLQTLLGPTGFRAGFDRYIKQYDGQAVTCDDFLDAMAKANERSLAQFASWYSSAGTPILVCTQHRDGEDLILRIRQEPAQHRNPKLPPTSSPLLIPVLIGFDDETASELWEIDQWDQEKRFPGRARSTASILRDCSAPVMLQDDLRADQVARLARCDGDPVNRWMMMQRLMSAAVLGTGALTPVIDALQAVLDDDRSDPAFTALMISFPPEIELAQALTTLDPQALRAQRQRLMSACADALLGKLRAIVKHMRWLESKRSYEANPRHAGERALGNAALLLWSYASETDPEVIEIASEQCLEASHMTDRAGGMAVLMRQAKPVRDQALADYERQFSHEALAMDRWLTMQASRHQLEGEGPVLDDVVRLMRHPCFSLRNPNKVRALMSSFCHHNLAAFHEPQGEAYRWFETQFCALDALNPQVAARLVRALERWPLLVEPMQSLAKSCLERLAHHRGLSNDSAEIVQSALAAYRNKPPFQA